MQEPNNSISQKTFGKKTLGGYDPKEVQAYLEKISSEYNTILDEKNELAEKLDAHRVKYEKMEETLLNAFKDAENFREHMIKEARKEADRLKEEGKIIGKSYIDKAKRFSDKLKVDAITRYNHNMHKIREQDKLLRQKHNYVDGYTETLMEEMRDSARVMQKMVNDIHGKIRAVNAMKSPSSINFQFSEIGEVLKNSHINKDGVGVTVKHDVNAEGFRKEKSKQSLKKVSTEKQGNFFDQAAAS